MNITNNLVKIGTKVNNGVVVGIMYGGYYEYIGKRTFLRWDKEYPAWRELPVYYVALETPQKQCSLEEFKESCPYIKEEYLEEEYSKVPLYDILSIPEEAIMKQLENIKSDDINE